MSEGTLSNVFRSCLNILRSENIVGEEALRNISYLIVFKLIESKTEEIKFEEYEYDNKLIDDDDFKKLLSYTKFSVIKTLDDDRILPTFKHLWDAILSKHPKTKDIFLQEKFFDVKQVSTLKKLITRISSLESAENVDIQGEAYEEVIKNIMVGKTLGQFFTPPKVKKIMVDLINPQLYDTGKCETIFDPAMGTGGFLISAIRHYTTQSKEKDIPINWKFMSKKGLGGREAVSNTYQIAQSNMLISTGHMFNSLEHGDSIRDPILKKYDIVLANPPFGIKGLNYDDITSEYRNTYLPIKTNNAVPLFIQAIISILKIGGRCAVVLPDGQDLFGVSEIQIKIREYLMKTCILKKIIIVPGGIFTNTSIKTCIFYFVKNIEGLDVITRSGAKYTFCENHSTKNVRFYNVDVETGVQNLIIKIPIERIASNNYSLNYNEYQSDEEGTHFVHKGTEDTTNIKDLRDVCDFKGGKQLSRKNVVEGMYPVIGGGQQPSCYHSEYNRNENVILVSSSGAYAGFISRYKTKVWASDCFSVHIKETERSVNELYLYYWLKENQESIYKLQTGSAQPHIYPANVSKLKITIPSLEKQKEIVETLDFLYENRVSNDKKISDLRYTNKICVKEYVLCYTTKGVNGVKALKDILSVQQGVYIKKEMKIDGMYPVYGGGEISYYINQYNRENEMIIAKDAVSKECIRFVKDKFFLNHHGWTVCIHETEILTVLKKFVYYYLVNNQNIVFDLAKGTAQLGINQTNFLSLKIPIPSIEDQSKVIEICERNDDLIKELENNNAVCERLCKQVMKNVSV